MDKNSFLGACASKYLVIMFKIRKIKIYLVIFFKATCQTILKDCFAAAHLEKKCVIKVQQIFKLPIFKHKLHSSKKL